MDTQQLLASAQELLNEGKNNASMQFLVEGGDIAKAMKSCQESHRLPELSIERALYVGAYMDTIHRLSKAK